MRNISNRSPRIVGLAAMALLAACSGSSSTAKPPAAAGPVTITVWHANVDAAAKTMDSLAERFHAANPDITVKVEQGAPADGMLTKLITVLGTDTYPDISYVFGTDTPALARSAKVVDLTATTKDPAFGWSDFYEVERAVATVNGKVVAVPALVDNLALVYNKKLFADAGVTPPTKDWSWSDYQAASKKLTNEADKVFGSAYPISADEDTVWRFWPMVWQQGGKGISDDGKQSTFTDPAFSKSLDLLRAMAIDDKSLYLDTNSDAISNLFAAGKVAMVITGPWALSTFRDGKVDYGVAPIPGFNGNHQTVSGPDNWMVFDNGAAKKAASIKFIQFLTSAEGDAEWSVGLGNMPVRNATQKLPAWQDALKENSGYQDFVDNFSNAKTARPQTIVYPDYSKALGEAIAAVLQGQESVTDALAKAKKAADAALAGKG
jgi:multiple sugar transport system substrate-binding protein